MTNVSLLPNTPRLDEEEKELRKISPAHAATGANASDYFQMYDLFMDVVQHARAMSADPGAFLNSRGYYNDKTINAYKNLMSTGLKALESLNKMRNSDKMTEFLIENMIRELVGSASVEIGLEIKKIIDAIDSGEDRNSVVIKLKRLMYKELPDIFVRSAKVSSKQDK